MSRAPRARADGVIAQQQRWLTFGCCLLALLSLLWWWPKAPWRAMLLAFWFSVAWWACVLGLQVLLSQWGNKAAWRQGQAGALRPASWCRAWQVWLWACWEAPKVFAWRQPWQEHRWPDVLPQRAPSAVLPDMPPAAQQPLLERMPVGPLACVRPVLFVHGFVANRGFWNPWLAHLSQRGEAFVAVSLSKPMALLDEQAAELSAHVDRIVQATGQTPLIVAHSMGGLVVRAWLRLEARQGVSWTERAHRVVCLGSPLAGTGVARWSHLKLARQMALPVEGRAWVQTLEADLQALGVPHSLFVCWASNADNMVFPAHSALLPEPAQCHVLQGVPHVPLAFHPSVMCEVLALRGLD